MAEPEEIATVVENMAVEIKNLKAFVQEQKLENEHQRSEIEALETATREQKREIYSLHGMCDVQYGDYCFFGRFAGDNNMMNIDAATSLCQEKGEGGQLANIYSRIHYNEVVDYFRPFLATIPHGDLYFFAWTAMTIRPESGTVYLSDGSQAPYVEWHLNNPQTDPTRTSISIYFDADGSYDGMFNYSPVTGHCYATLCQIPI